MSSFLGTSRSPSAPRRAVFDPALPSLLAATGLAVLLLFSQACSHTPPEVAVAPAQRDIAGTWKLNRDESDDPAAQLAALRQGRPGEGEGGGEGRAGGGRGGWAGGGGRGGMGRGGGGRGGMGGGRPGGAGGNPAAMQEGMAMLRQATEQFTLSQNDTTVTFAYGQGWSHAFRTNGKAVKETLSRGTLKTKATWEGANLVIDRDWGGGVKLDETYFRSPETPQLFVIVSFKTPRMSKPLEFRRVYDPVAGSN
jgi:hypothetical protein